MWLTVDNVKYDPLLLWDRMLYRYGYLVIGQGEAIGLQLCFGSDAVQRKFTGDMWAEIREGLP